MNICRKIGESYNLITYDDCKHCTCEDCPIFQILERVKKVELVQRAGAKRNKFSINY